MVVARRWLMYVGGSLLHFLEDEDREDERVFGDVFKLDDVLN